MKIAIIGAGAVGGYFGAQLHAAGEDVHFLVRPRSLAVLRERGLTVLSSLAPQQLASVQATDDPESIGHADIVMFTVKLPDAPAAARLLGPLVGPRTLVIPFQNGVEGPQILRESVPAAQVASGVAYIASALREAGVVVHGGPFARLRFGALDADQHATLEAFEATCRNAGIDAELVENIARTTWEKFVFLVGLSAMTATTRQPIGPIRADPVLRAQLREVMSETFEVGQAERAGLPADFVDERMRFVDSLPETMKASMLHDLEAGRPLELPWLSGAVVRLGAQHAIPTPANRAVVDALAAHAGGSQNRAPA